MGVVKSREFLSTPKTHPCASLLANQHEKGAHYGQSVEHSGFMAAPVFCQVLSGAQ